MAMAHFNLQNKVFWDVTPCRIYCILEYEDGGGMPPRNDSKYLPVDAAQYTR